MNSEQKAVQLLESAGITINGLHPWDPQVHDERTYDRIFSGGSLAVGESYMDGWWDVDDLPGFFFRLFHQGAPTRLLGIGIALQILKSKILNLQGAARVFQVAQKHYDIDNNLYEKMLGDSMVYSCGYWNRAYALNEAQEQKLDLIL